MDHIIAENDVQTILGAVASIGERVGEIKTDLNGLWEKVNEMSGSVSTVQTNVAVLRAELNHVSPDTVRDLEILTAKMHEQNEAMRKDVETLSRKVDILEQQRDKATGVLGAGKVIWVAVVALAGVVGWLVSQIRGK